MVLVILSVGRIIGLVFYAANPSSGPVNFTLRYCCSFTITAAERVGNAATDAMVTHSKKAVLTATKQAFQFSPALAFTF
jgi:hypothetical protein